MRVLATGAIEETLAQIASALRTPVLVLALVALLVCALEAGRFGAELYVRVRRSRESMRVLVRRAVVNPDQVDALAMLAPSAFAGEALLQIISAAQAGDVTAIERALAEYELAVERRLDRTRILVRAGPALGLMGTLIPLAPGLAALGRGEVGTLASDLRTAFAATTIGLLVGTVAYALTLTRTRLYSEDLGALEYALPPTAPTSNGQSAVPASDRQALPLPAPSSASTEPGRFQGTP